MKVAVLGGGTTGFIAAAHLSHFFPQHELLHVYDASRPVISVGEGTIPVFRRWLREVTGCADEEVVRRCHATLKHGLHFEGWGRSKPAFSHWFMPRGEARAWHLLGSELIELLGGSCRGSHIDGSIAATHSNGIEVTVELASGAAFTADLVLDGRGYPGPAAPAAITFDWIPTNAAVVRRGPAVRGQRLTRSVARPHGWIAVVPLRHQTVYGYIYDAEASAAGEVDADLHAFLAEEGTEPLGASTSYRFPNFASIRVFDGALYALGSRAGFIEPLEATALGTTLLQMMHLSQLILPDLAFHRCRGPYDPGFLDAYNRSFTSGMIELSLLIAWYYSRGSRFDTLFWRRASRQLDRVRADPRHAPRLATFDRWLERAVRFPDPDDDFEAFHDAWAAEPGSCKYGQLFRAHNLAAIGHGIAGFGGSGPKP